MKNGQTSSLARVDVYAALEKQFDNPIVAGGHRRMQWHEWERRVCSSSIQYRTGIHEKLYCLMPAEERRQAERRSTVCGDAIDQIGVAGIQFDQAPGSPECRRC